MAVRWNIRMSKRSVTTILVLFRKSALRAAALFTVAGILSVISIAEETPEKVSLKLDAPDKGILTPGDLGIGKFYTFSRPPMHSFADVDAGLFTSGTKLTDGVFQETDGFDKSLYVGWENIEPVEIEIDLGRPQTLETLLFHGYHHLRTPYRAPAELTVSVRPSPDASWTEWGRWKRGSEPIFPDDSYVLRIDGKTAQVRFVRLQLISSLKTHVLLIREIELAGKIKNTWKYVPSNGSYHGAFPPTYGFKEPLRGGRKEKMAVPIFEELVGKKLAMVLWYQGLDPKRPFSEIHAYRCRDLAENFPGQRLLSLAWLPSKNVSLDDLVRGRLDEFLRQYYTDMMDETFPDGCFSPIWLRPMNEFNAYWVHWGLDPENFKRAWRRLYNIAEKLGVAERHVFVWSPNHRSYPDLDWNKMERYYPGDQYVDWVGVSCYPPSLVYVENEDARYPLLRVREIHEKYGHYKPMMIAEGGYSAACDRSRWLREWFEFRQHYPRFKAMIWENHNDRVLQDDDEALRLYRREIQSDYWIGEFTDFSLP